ncbi:MAG: hypothetical protein AAF636_15465 [Pseudomonadota bacterium]
MPLLGITLTEEKIAEVLAQLKVRLAAYATEAGEAVFPTSAHIITQKNIVELKGYANEWQDGRGSMKPMAVLSG